MWFSISHKDLCGLMDALVSSVCSLTPTGHSARILAHSLQSWLTVFNPWQHPQLLLALWVEPGRVNTWSGSEVRSACRISWWEDRSLTEQALPGRRLWRTVLMKSHGHNNRPWPSGASSSQESWSLVWRLMVARMEWYSSWEITWKGA